MLWIVVTRPCPGRGGPSFRKAEARPACQSCAWTMSGTQPSAPFHATSAPARDRATEADVIVRVVPVAAAIGVAAAVEQMLGFHEEEIELAGAGGATTRTGPVHISNRQHLRAARDQRGERRVGRQHHAHGHPEFGQRLRAAPTRRPRGRRS